MVTEATERQQVVVALRQSQKQLRLAVEATQLGLWDFDPVHWYLVSTLRCREMLGVPPSTYAQKAGSRGSSL